MRKIGSILLFALLVLAAVLGNWAPAADATSTSHHHSSAGRTSRSTSKSPAKRAAAVAAGACRVIAKEMKQAADADVTKSDAENYASSSMKALKLDRNSPLFQRVHHDAEAFARLFALHPFNPVPLAVVQDCANRTLSAPLISSTSSTTTTTTSPSGSPVAAVTALVQSSLSVPDSEITVQLDRDETTWAYWTVNDPNSGVAAGFAELIGGTWEIYAGPGSADVGCSPGPTVPPQVLTYFGQSCSPAGNTGASGSGATGASGNSGTTGNSGTNLTPTIAYERGYQSGQNMAVSGSLLESQVEANCRVGADDLNRWPTLAAQYLDGCMAGAGY